MTTSDSNEVEDDDSVPEDVLTKAFDNEFTNINRFADKISELCKFVWAGSLATYFALLMSPKDTPGSIFFIQSKCFLLAAAACGTAAYVCDYLQSIYGYSHAMRIVSWIHQEDDVTYTKFNQMTESKYSRLNSLFFILKNVFAIIAAVLLVCAIGFYVST